MSTLTDKRVLFEQSLFDLLNGLDYGTGGGGSQILPSRLRIVNFVKAKLDELIPEGEGITFSLSAEPNVSDPYSLLINAHLDESTKDVILSAPLSILAPTAYTDITEGTPFVANGLTGYFVLPANLQRLSSFKMVDWLRDVTEFITPQHPAYKKQSNQFLKGGTVKPVAVLNWKTIDVEGTPTPKRILEYYSVETSHNIDKFMYIPEQLAEDFITANPNLLDALAWMCAAKILQIIGMGEPAKMAMEQVTLSYNNLL